LEIAANFPEGRVRIQLLEDLNTENANPDVGA
jgi:hypothetical protein